MKTRLVKLIVFAAALAFVFAFGSHVRADQMRVDRDLGIFHTSDAVVFGDDRALNSASGVIDRDAESMQGRFVPDTYGLMGNYGRISGY